MHASVIPFGTDGFFDLVLCTISASNYKHYCLVPMYLYNTLRPLYSTVLCTQQCSVAMWCWLLHQQYQAWKLQTDKKTEVVNVQETPAKTKGATAKQDMFLM